MQQEPLSSLNKKCTKTTSISSYRGYHSHQTAMGATRVTFNVVKQCITHLFQLIQMIPRFCSPCGLHFSVGYNSMLANMDMMGSTSVASDVCPADSEVPIMRMCQLIGNFVARCLTHSKHTTTCCKSTSQLKSCSPCKQLEAFISHWRRHAVSQRPSRNCCSSV